MVPSTTEKADAVTSVTVHSAQWCSGGAVTPTVHDPGELVALDLNPMLPAVRCSC